ncbi:MAG: HEAT repeat domain-containing protein [Anaerolineae bacterium]|nr:HEAT repeat domain-containing protein [Anaerolineae bacterium]
MADYDKFLSSSGDEPRKKPTLEATISSLKNLQGDMLPATIYYGLSDLEPGEIRTLADNWYTLAPDLRRRVIAQLAETSEISFEFDYRQLGHLALSDTEPTVRAAAIDLLWTDDSLGLMYKLIERTEKDESRVVRAAAASALGRFILLGEYLEIDEDDARKAQDAVIRLWNDSKQDFEVRRRALEAISNSSHDIVNPAIAEAYNSDEHLMRVSAIFAMGKAYDHQWSDTVLKEMGNSDAEIRYEATRAAGELMLEQAIPMLGRLAVEDEREIKEVAIWSLGEIGGNESMRILTALAEAAEESGDLELLDSIEEALDNAALAGELLELEDEYDEDDEE